MCMELAHKGAHTKLNKNNNDDLGGLAFNHRTQMNKTNMRPWEKNKIKNK